MFTILDDQGKETEGMDKDAFISAALLSFFLQSQFNTF